MNRLRATPLAPARRTIRVLLCRLSLLAGSILCLVAPHPAAAQEETEEYFLARLEYERARFYSGSGASVAELMLRARRQVQAMGPAGVSLVELPWRPLGPDRVEEEGLVRAGRVSAIAIHPRDRNILYVGGAQGGVWRSDDAGATWTPLTDGECSLSIGAIAIDPVNPDIVYAGTGESVAIGRYGCGVLRSLNGGMTWEQLGADVFVQTNDWFGGARISRLVIDPATAGSAGSTTVLAATLVGVFRSTDSGRTWTRVLRGAATDLVMRPGDPSVLYAATRAKIEGWELPAAADEYGVFRSTDGGRTWTPASEGLPNTGVGRIGLAIAPSAPDVMYAALERQGDGVNGPFLFRSRDGAATWEPAPAAGVNRGAIHPGGGWNHGMVLVVHPLNDATLYFGNTTLHVSNDGGDSFRFPTGDYWENYNNIYVDQQFLVVDTLSGPGALYLANDGGVYRSTNGGFTWSSLATNLAVQPVLPGHQPASVRSRSDARGNPGSRHPAVVGGTKRLGQGDRRRWWIHGVRCRAAGNLVWGNTVEPRGIRRADEKRLRCPEWNRPGRRRRFPDAPRHGPRGFQTPLLRNREPVPDRRRGRELDAAVS